MLPKRSRLSAAEVRAILTGGRSVRLSTVSAKYIRAEGSKAAVVVSKKVAKTAVLRNRLRRAGYAALAAPPAGKHIVFFIQKVPFDKAELSSLCLKLS